MLQYHCVDDQILFLANEVNWGINRKGLYVIGCVGHWEFWKLARVVAHKSMFPLYPIKTWCKNRAALFLIPKGWLCWHTQVCSTFLFKKNYCLLCFPCHPQRRDKFFIHATFILTNIFLRLYSFSRTIHITLLFT